MKTFQRIKQAQESLREKHWDPQEQWRVIQETITWAESQKTVERNTPRYCLQKQAKLLMALGGRKKSR